jgi:hypothetical protein
LTLTNAGNVGIGTESPTYLLTMGIGGGYYNESTGAWVDGSDRIYKDNIVNLSKYGLKTVSALRPVSYVVKQSGIEQIGFIAQEVRDLIPELVSGEDGAMGLNYGRFTPVLVKAIQEQQLQIATTTLAMFGTSTPALLSGGWFATTNDELSQIFSQPVPPASALQQIMDRVALGFVVLKEFAVGKVMAVAGYFEDIWANRIHIQEVCIGATGNETCINKDRLDRLLRQSGISGGDGATDTDAVAPASAAPPSTEDQMPPASTLSASAGEATPPIFEGNASSAAAGDEGQSAIASPAAGHDSASSTVSDSASSTVSDSASSTVSDSAPTAESASLNL